MDRKITIFEQKVYDACRSIPKGRVSTYQEIAKAIKRPFSFRAVGNALHQNPFAPVVPCHRVVRSNGDLGGFAQGNTKKMQLLQEEGIELINGKIIDLNKYLFKFH